MPQWLKIMLLVLVFVWCVYRVGHRRARPSVALIAGGDPGARVAGLIAVVFFGGGGLVYWGLTAPRRRETSPVSADKERVVYSTSRSRAALRSAGAGVFVFVLVGGAIMFAPTLVSGIFPPVPVIIVGAVCVLYFGMVLVVLAVPSLIRPGGSCSPLTSSPITRASVAFRSVERYRRGSHRS